jgi:WD40 repeat protein
LYRLFLGNDVFLSYGRLDGSSYIEALDRQLSRAGLVCYFDRRGASSGKRIPREVLFQLVHSSVLVVVAGPKAAASKNVGREIWLFHKENRPIIPIDFEGALEKAKWHRLVENIASEKELLSSLLKSPTPVPAEEVVQRIINVEETVSRHQRLRQIYLYTAGGILVLLLSSVVFTDFKVMEASEKQLEAESVQKWEEARARRASRNAKKAEKAAAAAKGETERAQTETARQQAIAGAYLLVNEAEDLRTRNLDTVEKSVRQAAEALGRFQSLGQVSLEADRALRRSLELVRPCIAEIPRQSTSVTTSVALSPDGRIAALANEERGLGPGGATVEVWSITPGTRRSRCTGRAVKIGSIPFWMFYGRHFYEPPVLTFAGKALAVAYAGTLRLCSGFGDTTLSCQEVTTFPSDHTMTAFDASGRYFAWVSDLDGSAQVWDLENGRSFPSIHLVEITRKGNVKFLAVSPTGPQLALGVRHEEGSDIYVVGIPDGKVRHQFPAASFLGDLALSRDGRWLAASSGWPEHEIVIWDLQGTQQISIPFEDHALHTLSFSPDAGTFAGGGGSRGTGTALIWDVFTRKEIARLVQPEDVVQIAYSADGQFLALASESRVRIWNVDHGPADAPFFAVKGHGQADSALDRSGRYVAATRVVASRQEELGVWDIAGRRRLISETFRASLEPSLTFSPSSRYFFLSHDQAWELPAGTPVPLPPCYTPSFSRNDQLVACKAADALKIWREGEKEPRLKIPGSAWLGVELSPGGVYVAAKDDAGTVRVWPVPRDPGTQPRELFSERAPSLEDRRVLKMSWSPDDRFLAIRRLSGRLAIWSTQTKQVLPCPEDASAVRDFEFSPDGAFLFAVRDPQGWRAGELRVCGLHTPASEWVFGLTKPSQPRGLATHPDGRHVAVGLTDGSVEIWDVLQRARVAHLGLSTSPPSEIAFSDARHLVSMTFEGAVRTWLWRPEDLIKEAFRRLGEEPPRDLLAKPAAAPR